MILFAVNTMLFNGPNNPPMLPIPVGDLDPI